MLHTRSLVLIFCLLSIGASAQTADLVGYWHNWDDANAPYIPLTQIDSRYTIIEVAFAIPAVGTSHQMVFTPDQVSQAQLIAEITTLQAQGRKVLISIGGATAAVHLDTDQERDEFVTSMLNIINTYGFDGMDIDLEGSSVSISGGTISAPIDSTIIRLIDATMSIMSQYHAQNGVKMFLTMAPETAYVQGGQSAYGGIWGAYLPIIDALRDSIDVLQVQLYNSGSMYGIDGNIYTQGNADFIVSQTEALLQGFNTGGGFFAPLNPEQVAIGLPACPLAAGGGYTTPSDVVAAVRYLRGLQGQPGSYVALGQYPDLRGLMTWSVNWDLAASCGPMDEFAVTFEDAFALPTGVSGINSKPSVQVWPNPVSAGSALQWNPEILGAVATAALVNRLGTTTEMIPTDRDVLAVPSGIAPGTYLLRLYDLDNKVLLNERVVIYE